MTRFKRRILIGTALVVLILVGLVFFFYRPTRLALERAEAFQFRRMLVTKLDDQDAYRFFYVTNRSLREADGPFEERFGNQRQEALKFGLFDTAIEPTLGLGMLINPTDWFQNEEIQLRQVQPLDQIDFVAQLRRQVHASPLRSLLVNVNGFRERFPSALRKTAFLSHVLDIDRRCWFSTGRAIRDRHRAGTGARKGLPRASGAELAGTLELIIRQIQPDRLWLVANSMGAQVVVHAFSILYREADLADAQTEIENVVLTAPDVDRAEFNEQFKKEIAALVAKSHGVCLLQRSRIADEPRFKPRQTVGRKHAESAQSRPIRRGRRDF